MTRKTLWILALGLFACGSTAVGVAATKAANGQCPAVGDKACESDDSATKADVDECNGNMNDPKCGGLYTDFYKCIGTNAACDTNGHQSADYTVCTDASVAWTDCTGVTYDGGILVDAGGT
ncbi:MAG TPA: hypothetical protein VF407_19310 [Polyangiaceae bacterium]